MKWLKEDPLKELSNDLVLKELQTYCLRIIGFNENKRL